MRVGLWLSLAIIVINLLVNGNGETKLFSTPMLGFTYLNLTLESLIFGLVMSIRLMAMLSAFYIGNLTVHYEDVTHALSKLRVPYTLLLTTSISLRFTPILIGALEKIEDSQRCRGLEMDKGNFIERVKSRIPVLIPLISISLERAFRVAEALEARGFQSTARRSYFKNLIENKRDVKFLFYASAPLPFGFLGKFLGFGSAQFFPVIRVNCTTLNLLASLALLALLLLLPVSLRVKK